MIFRFTHAAVTTVALVTIAGAGYLWPSPERVFGQSNPAVVGQWSPVYTLQPPGALVAAIHTHVLPNGKVLIWETSGETWLWDGVPPASGSVVTNMQNVRTTTTTLFCSGHAFMPDGRLLVAGGHDGHDPTARTEIFDYRTNAWTAGPDMPAVIAGLNNQFTKAGRWYPTVTPLSNGEMLVAAGDTGQHDGQENNHPVQTPLVFTSRGTWRALQTNNVAAAAPWEKWYPFLFAAPNGLMFRAGGSDEFAYSTGYLDVHSEAFTQVTTARAARYYSSAVMYDVGKVLVVGGGYDRGSCAAPSAVATAERIDLTVASPQWQDAPMTHAREYHDATVLADGTVFVTGGQNVQEGAVLTPELWTPASGTWSPMAPMARPRGYHSSAVLLPDARVLVGGYSFAGVCKEPNVEFFSPPYLHSGLSRPTITSAPVDIFHGVPFTVATPDHPVDRVTMVRLSSTTHGFNENQRFVPLTFDPDNNDPSLLRVLAPDPNAAPPGHYMLFILKGGVPSLARIVRVSQPDLLVWRNEATSPPNKGRNAFWYRNGAAGNAATEYPTPEIEADDDLTWEIRATADMNGDLYPDLIWQKKDSTEVRVWTYQGSEITDGIVGRPKRTGTPSIPNDLDATWRIAGAGRMDKDR